MSVELEKAALFVKRLLQNPTLKNLTPLMCEEQILQFIITNSRQLYPTLSSAAFFPGKNWEQIVKLLVQALYAEVDSRFLPEVEEMIMGRLDFAFLQFLRQQSVPQQKVKEDFFTFVSSSLRNPDIRRELSGTYNAMKFGYVDRYIDEAFDRNEYVHFELTKVQRLKMSKEDIKDFVGASLFLKPAVFLLATSHGKSAGEALSGTVQIQFIEKVSTLIQDKLKVFPEQVIRSGLYANASFQENRSMDATSRIASVLAALGKNCKPQLKIDRGADSADKSWLSVARRNFKFYGYDIKLLDEFYKIAAENGW